MPRYIDADALIKTIYPIGVQNDLNYVINAKAVKVAIDKQPTADVEEVVRCKDCEFYLNDTEYCKLKNVGYCKYNRIVKSPFSYCSSGERKEV